MEAVGFLFCSLTHVGFRQHTIGLLHADAPTASMWYSPAYDDPDPYDGVGLSHAQIVLSGPVIVWRSSTSSMEVANRVQYKYMSRIKVTGGFGGRVRRYYSKVKYFKLQVRI